VASKYFLASAKIHKSVPYSNYSLPQLCNNTCFYIQKTVIIMFLQSVLDNRKKYKQVLVFIKNWYR